MSPTTARNLTILLTDIKGFSDKTSRKSRSEIMAMLDKHKELVLPLLEGSGGRLVKTIGDAFLMVFESPTDAVLAGVAVQQALRAHNEGKAEDDRIEVRIAINAGEVSLTDSDIFGEPVNITARIGAVAETGEVFFTEAVYLAMNKKEVPSSEVGLLQLKGIPEKVRVYRVRREQPVGAAIRSAGAAPGASRVYTAESAPAARAEVWRRAAAFALDLALCLVLTGLLSGGKKDGGPPPPLVWVLVNFACLSLWGTTPAGRLLGLRVAREDGSPIGKREAIIRAVSGLVSLFVLLLGFLSVLWEKEGRGWHDLMAGTRVVRR